ncbi:MAG: NAD(P)-binding domain-containing protein [Chloroflexota bacterium]|nr:NAD(P)-binding domain-containing protein [Chloroflexota bacterium]
MKALYFSQPNNLQPWFDDVVRAVGGQHSVLLYQAGESVAKQLHEVQVVIDQGGASAPGEAVAAAAASGVRLWQVLGTGLEHVDVRGILSHRLPLANTPGQFSSIALAEHALFLMLYIAKNFATARRNLQAGTFYHPINDELEGQTLGLVGLGASGQELARRARHLGMQLLGLDVKQPSDETLHELGVKYLGGPGQLSQLFGQSDYVSIHVPLTRATKKMVDAHVLAGLRPGGVLINVARGEVVDQGALLEALRIGQVRAAGLDVFAEEPIDGRHPLLRLDNVVATPHVAGVTGGTSRRRAEAVAENIRRVASGLYPLYTIHSGDV